jgi:hypothetical protein
MAGKKVPERRSGLRPSEKELPERRSGAFHHKNTPLFFSLWGNIQKFLALYYLFSMILFVKYDRNYYISHFREKHYFKFRH